MRAVMLRVPESWFEERARRGLDRFDEIWEGMLHMVPGPSFEHQTIGHELDVFLSPILSARGIEVRYEMEVHRPGSKGEDYRIPDMVFFRSDRPEIITRRGLEGAPLAVLEIRSPDDETYEKFDFWTALGVAEVIVIDPDKRTAEVYRLAGKQLLATSADEQGRVHAATIDARFSTVAGEKPRLRVQCAGEAREI